MRQVVVRWVYVVSRRGPTKLPSALPCPSRPNQCHLASTGDVSIVLTVRLGQAFDFIQRCPWTPLSPEENYSGRRRLRPPQWPSPPPFWPAAGNRAYMVPASRTLTRSACSPGATIYVPKGSPRPSFLWGTASPGWASWLAALHMSRSRSRRTWSTVGPPPLSR